MFCDNLLMNIDFLTYRFAFNYFNLFLFSLFLNSELNLAVAAHISDRITDEVIESLSRSYKTLVSPKFLIHFRIVKCHIIGPKTKFID